MSELENRLREEIMSEAREQAARIVADAEAEAKKIAAESSAAVARMREEALSEAASAVATASRKSSAAVELEIGRRWLRVQESGIDQVLSEALSEAEGASGERRVASLCSLAQEAFRGLGVGRYVVRACKSDAGVVTVGWVESQAKSALGEDCGVACDGVELDDGIKGGLVIASSDGRKTFDNTYATRLMRMRDGLRLLVVNG